MSADYLAVLQGVSARGAVIAGWSFFRFWRTSRNRSVSSSSCCSSAASSTRRTMRTRCGAQAACLVLLALAPAAANQPGQEDLKRLTIEELMEIDVTTAGRQEQPIGTTAAAISVITGDDIRRAGVSTIADALLLADGVHVARFNTGTWRITARGFNGTTPNKLLVMIDGRTVYSPLFTGVFWNVIDYPLEDIERIEVIRGPGATLWGANAVNGVINIITRHARDTRGTLVSLSAGNEDRAIAEVRYGAGDDETAWRVYGKFAARDDQLFASGGPSSDARRRTQGGFRLDHSAGPAAWTLKGDAFFSRDGLPQRADGEFIDVSLQARWSRTLANSSSLTAQSYYRREYRRVPEQLTHRIDVFDVDLQHSARIGTRHNLVWGGGIRVSRDETHGSDAIRFDPTERTYPLGSVFIQDEIALVPGRLFATGGIKYEHNAFSGGELQPNVRGRLLLSPRHMLWGAVSRAVRRPTRLDDDVVVSAPGGTLLVVGTHDFEAEKLTATEFGYRIQPATTASVDATLFWHRFDDLRSQDAPPAGSLPLTLGNTLEGRSRGLELGVNVQPVPWWRTHLGYTWLDTEVTPQPGSRDLTGGVSEANDPNHLFGLRTSFDLPRNVEIDAVLRAVGSLPNPAVPAYTELTLRGGWHVTPRVELAVVGQDLLHDRHPEIGPDDPTRIEFERAVRIVTTLRF